METKTFLSYPVGLVLGVKETKGNVIGIELELEGRNVGLQDIATKGWTRHHDGSLRGESIEYTTTGAKSVEEAKKLVVDLFDKFKANGVQFNDSIRTSTHVHLNFADKPIKQAVNFFSLFTLLEEVLQYYSGEDRKGNLFCISSREAEGIIGELATCIGRGDFNRFAGDRYKYAACNLSTLYKFGTIEVRTMRGAISAEQVNTWIDMLNEMYEYSLNKMVSPVDLIRDLSILGAERLMQSIFNPNNYKELLGTFPSIKTLHYSLMEGARLLQLFAYEYEEDFQAKVDISKMEGARLPRVIPSGPLRGGNYAIYKPDGSAWNVTCNGQFWLDGEVVRDDNHVAWSQERQRFICVRPEGEVYECKWRCHHAIPDEGRPEVAERLPMNMFLIQENQNEEVGQRFVPFAPDEDEDEMEEVEPDWGDDNEEGDDF